MNGTPDIDFNAADPTPRPEPRTAERAAIPPEPEQQMELATDDERLPPYAGITTVLGSTIHPGDRTLLWAWKQGQRGILLTDRRSTEGRQAGAVLHRIFEDIVKGERPHIQALLVHVRSRVESLIAWWDATRPKIVAVELRLYDPVHRVRGRIDYVRECTLEGCPCAGRGLIVGDHKSGAPGTLADPKNRIQVGGGYRILWTAAPDPFRDRPLCATELVLLPDGGRLPDGEPYAVKELPDSTATFLAALHLYRDMQTNEDLPQRTI